MATKTVTNTDYFSYTDAHGAEVIVQRLDEVPASYRTQAKHIDLSKPAITLRNPAWHVVAWRGNGLCLRGQASCFHWPSVAVGAGMAITLGLVAVMLLRRASRLFWFIVGLAAVTVLSTAYLGYLRYQAGLSHSGFASPGDIIDDARRAAQSANSRNQAQERVLQDLENQR